MKSITLLMALICMSACGPGINSVPKDGPAGPAGAKGDTGAQGAQGNPGVDGAQGPQGPSGANGADGTVVTPIALCPSVHGNGFNESLLRIGSQLYGVYSSNGNVFLISLPFGYSYFTTDGRNCHFNIDVDGNVL